jgi:hypothetical protein
MKKIIAVLMSLLFVVSVFGIASTTAFSPTLKATPTNVAVGEIITVTYDKSGFYDHELDVIAYDNLPKGGVVKLSGPTYNATEDMTYWTYRATSVGTVVFSTGPKTDPVTITPKPHPIASFMKILGLGKEK